LHCACSGSCARRSTQAARSCPRSACSSEPTNLNDFWAYLTLAVSGIVTEEATPLIGGLAAHDRRLDLVAVVVWVAVGTWVADAGLYYFGYLGRGRGDWVRRRWPKVRTVVLPALLAVRRHPWRSSLAVRFAYGLRLTLPLACGAARVPILLYAVASGISAFAWSLLFTMLGWGFGRTTLIILGHVRRYERFLVPGIVIGVIIAWWLMRARHVDEDVVEVLATGHRKAHGPSSPSVAEPPGPV
jgi:membrane protein DedA with SNARE-associated domain